jgi:hypothetical protein
VCRREGAAASNFCSRSAAVQLATAPVKTQTMASPATARRLRRTLHHLRDATAAATDELTVAATAPQLSYCDDPSPEGIVHALRTDGCALIRGVIPTADAARLATELAGYAPGGAAAREDLMRDDPMLAALARPNQLGGDLVEFGASGSAELLGTLFQRDQAWLQLVDPSPIVDAADLALGDSCHLINQKGWRNHPGHDAAGAFHTDELFVSMPEEIASDPRYEPPIHIITALFYLVDVDVELCPTWVIPKSFRAGRGPEPGETSWRDNNPMVVCAKQGDCLMFRSEVWHGGGENATADRHRYVCETVYGARKVAQKFVRGLISSRQRLVQHVRSTW